MTGGYQAFCDNSYKALLLKSVTMGRGPPPLKILPAQLQDMHTSFILYTHLAPVLTLTILHNAALVRGGDKEDLDES
jgi:hypothetical protein